MISLYRVIGTVEAYVLAEREEDACERMKSVSLGEHRGAVSFAPTETIKVTEDDLSPGAAKSKPVLAQFTELPETRAGWTCGQWANATRSDCIREAESLRKEATRIEEHAARLRAQIAMLEALAQPKAPVARDPALDGDAKTTTGPREDFAPLHPDMFGGTDYPGALP